MNIRELQKYISATPIQQDSQQGQLAQATSTTLIFMIMIMIMIIWLSIKTGLCTVNLDYRI